MFEPIRIRYFVMFEPIRIRSSLRGEPIGGERGKIFPGPDIIRTMIFR